MNDLFETFYEPAFGSYEMVPLLEHRGKPDPEKVRQREEAHKRGLERSKNAQKRRVQQARARSERENRKLELMQLAQKQQKQKQEKQKGVSQQTQQRQQKHSEERKKADNQMSQAKQHKSNLDNSIYKMQQTAPTEASKQVARQLTSDINKFRQQFGQDFKGYTDSDKTLTQQQLTNKKQQIEQKVQDYFDQTEKSYSDKVKNDDKGSKWLKDSLSSLRDYTKSFVVSCFDLIGYKDIYDGFKEGTKWVFGRYS